MLNYIKGETMKFKNLNEDVHAEKFAKNVRSRTLLAIKDFELENFAEQEGSTKAITDINRHVGYALEGREPILDVLIHLLSLKKDAERDIEYTKNEFKRDSAIGYVKTMNAFMGDTSKEDLMSIKWK